MTAINHAFDLTYGRPRSKTARRWRESVVMAALIGCGLFTVATTVSIVAILALQTLRFFGGNLVDAQGDVSNVGIGDFLLGLEWNPLLGSEKNFGIWPLIGGTMLVSAVAMAVALPLGLVTAIWLSEYARPKVRAVAKPVLEVLAGIPTVVFGFFALTFITPLLRFEWMMVDDGHGHLVPWNPLEFGTYNALGAGLAVGILCLPIVTSLAEDALRAVPQALREGSYGLGASRFETSIRVVVPAALSGIIAAFLLAIARAVGETMTVALAAGNSPINLAANPAAIIDPRSEAQTMTGYMVQIFLGDIAHGTVEYYSSYAVAATLFTITLLLTFAGAKVRKRFRQVYD